MANLVSPGVQVSIVDESFYAGAGPGTVPFLMIATASNKPQPGSTTAVAPGTIKANAGKLYLASSQRELLQLFGNPSFRTQAGTPQLGSELNELGLYSAYQYLGLANRAWVMRADVDLAALDSRNTPPVGAPTNGSHWLDLSNTSWGLFRSSGNINSSLAWSSVTPLVIDSADQLELVVEARTATPTLDSNSVLVTTGGTLTVAGLPVTIPNSSSLNEIAQLINTAVANTVDVTKKSLRAEIAEFDSSYVISGAPDRNSSATIYNLRIVSSDINIDGGLVFGSSGGLNLAELGLTATPTNVTLPINSLGTTGSIAVNAASSISGINNLVTQVQMFEKISFVTDSGTQARWFLIGSAVPASAGLGAGLGWREATPTVVTGTASNVAIIPDHISRITIGATSADFTVPAAVAPSSTVTLAQLVTALNEFFAVNNMRAVASVAVSGPSSRLRITNFDGTSIGVVDLVGSLFKGLGISVSQTFYSEAVGTTNVGVGVGVFSGAASFVITVGDQTSNNITPDADLEDLVSKINSDAVVGATGLITASIVEQAGNTFLKIASSTGAFFSIENIPQLTTETPVTETCGIPAGVTFGNSLVYQGYSVSQPQPRQLSQLAAGNIWINTVSGNRGSAWSVRRYNAGINTWQPRSAPLYLNDASASSAYGSQRIPGSFYVQYNSASSSPVDATLLVKIWNGTAWISAELYQAGGVQVPYTQSIDEPQGSPEDGALWFNQNLRVDVMVSDGTQWMGYRQMYPGTDPNGVILSATAPSYQSDGFTVLADNDLWIDTSDLENYPKMYRWDSFGASWTLIDNTDQTSSQGVVFADARPNATGTVTGSEAIQQMLLSSYVDPDAPSALTYPFGMLLFNTRYSTNNVKQWRTNYLPTAAWPHRWVTASGNALDGSALMGRKAQRIMVVREMAASIVENQDLRAESNFFNLIAAPGYPELIDEMVTLNTDKKDVAFVVVDPPARLTPDATSVQAWATNSNNAASNGEVGLITRSKYAGVYYPWGLATNLDGNEIFVPPSTAILRTLAFNDQVSYPWFAPAGFNRGLVSVLTSVGYLSSENEYVPVQLSQGQSDVLYENNINPIRFIPGRGLVVYGQKTLSPVQSAIDRINVSRLVNYLNFQLDNLAKPFLFEPNDEYTRDSVTRTFESFFGDLVSLRAVYDFAVLCDESNNTPPRIDRNELYIDIAIRPVKSIEFILIPIRLLNTGDPLPT
jgi:hypothetical protein